MFVLYFIQSYIFLLYYVIQDARRIEKEINYWDDLRRAIRKYQQCWKASSIVL